MRDAVLSDLTAEGRLVDAGYLAALTKLAWAAQLFRHDWQSEHDLRTAVGQMWVALAAVEAHPTWQAAGQRQEGSSDA